MVSTFRSAARSMALAAILALMCGSGVAAQSASAEVGGLIFTDLSSMGAAGSVLRLNEDWSVRVRVQNPDNTLVRVWFIPFIENRDRICEVSYQGADALRLTGVYLRELYLTGGCNRVEMDGIDIVVLHEETGQEFERRIMFGSR